MRVKVEPALSPSEAREIFGLPDFSELHSTIKNDLLKNAKTIRKRRLKLLLSPIRNRG